ncbi:MAG: phosphohistidine phosphatase SixA [Candidatus Hydrogenedentes bacterium]|nr:phosphohistidine phosphatase SixA [Candidatus Hydrogenedentota bacterium]
MTIYLVQHGDALEKEVDPDRPLSPKGIEDVTRIASFLSRAGVRIPHLWHSGKTRAMQTAQILFQYVGAGGMCESHAGMAPKDSPKTLARDLDKQSQDTALVGHLPQLSLLAAQLLAGDSERPPILFERGGVVCLKRSEGAEWQVAWMVTPSLLTGLASHGS